MTGYGLLAVGVGSIVGAWLRWGLSHMFNPIFPTLPLGTLGANLIGGFFMGLMMGMMTKHVSLPQELVLMIGIGGLGSLTTFSTFSAEIVTLLTKQEFLWSVVAIVSHVVGTLVMTLVGMWSIKLFPA